MQLPRCIRAGAFTLIELLVVISIIAVLAGMLLPAVSLVRNSAQGSVCQGKLRQIGMAFMVYGDDQEGQIAPWQEGTYNWKTYVGEYEWHGTEGSMPGWGGRIYPYLGETGSWRIFVCPGDPVRRDLTDRASNGGQGTSASYSMAAKPATNQIRGLSYFGAAVNPTFTHTVRFSQLRYRADSCLIGDDSGLAAANPIGYFYQTTYLPRHGDGLNAVFCDGHVARVPLKPYFDFSLGGPVGDYTSPFGRFWNSR